MSYGRPFAASLATRMQLFPHHFASSRAELASVRLAQSRGHLEEALAKPHQDATPAILPVSALAALSLAVTALLLVAFLLSKRRLREVPATLLVALFMGLALVGVAIARWSSLPVARTPEVTPSALVQTETKTEADPESERSATDEGKDEDEAEAEAARNTEAETDAATETDESEAEPETETEAAGETETADSTTPEETAAAIANARAASSPSLAAVASDRPISSASPSAPRPSAAPPSPATRQPRARIATPPQQPAGGGRATPPDYRQLPTRVVFRPLLRQGDRGYDVALLQQLLARLGYYDQAADGDFGRRTEAAVKAFQRDRNLAVDGMVGFSTCNVLRALALELDDSPLDGTTMQCP